jgi:iron complex outermembrane recepter protein
MLLRSTLLAALLAVPVAAAAQGSDYDGTLVVEATRTGKPLTAQPMTITVITRDDIDRQLALGGDIAQLIGNLVPSYSPSRQKLSGFGETLRGREPLILIDGVPQSNPLRNGSRDGYTIDPDMIERVEIIHGANAIQGTGATGGIINYVTKTGGTPETRYSIQAGVNDDFDGDSLSSKLHLQHSGTAGSVDYLLAAGVHQTGMFFDADDRPIGVDNAQGDTMDGDGHDLFAKVGYALDDAQRLQFTANRFEFGSDGDWVGVPGDPAIGLPATSVPGVVDGVPAVNEVTTLALDYGHEALGPGALHLQVFRQDFAAIYGGAAFDVFQDPALGPDWFDQSRNASEKNGLKLTYNLPRLLHPTTDLTVGFDWLRDTSMQDLVQSGRLWVPESTYDNHALFAQVGVALGVVDLSAGLRHERADLDVPDFTTLAAYNSTFVEGGTPSFSETLVNAGINWRLNDAWSVFGGYSEGFNMPDVGRVLRGINTPDQSVDSFLTLQPIVADNLEFGTRFIGDGIEFRASVFRSYSDAGARLVPDADGIFSVLREKTLIEGVELGGLVDVSDAARLGLSYAHTTGDIDTDNDGAYDADLDGVNVAPDRANLYWEHRWSTLVDTRVQLNHVFDRDFHNAGVLSASFDGYQTVDLIAHLRFGQDSLLQFGVENALDKQYITYYSQVYPFAGADGYFAGRGRTLYATYRAAF